MNHHTPFVITCGVMAVAGAVILGGCTPEEEQAFRDAVNTTLQDAAKQTIDFVLAFGRQALAAFLL